MVTIKDVARRAGVSITTVSHVINDTRFVSDGLRSRVLAAMQELNYHPNVLARSLRRGETNMIGLIVPDNSNPYFAEVARIIEDTGFKNGYNVILCNSDNSLEKESAYIDLLIAKQVDGVIFIATGAHQEGLSELLTLGIPVVVADRDIRQSLADVVLVDNLHGGLEATRYLLALGHRRIACITGPSTVTPSADRAAGYRQALVEAGLPIAEELTIAGDFTHQGGESAMAELLHVGQPPSAVLACNDIMAIGALRSIRAVGLRVPEDISLIGFDNIALASALSPALTTVAQPIAELGTQAVQLLLPRIHAGESQEPGRRIVLPTRLIIRDSCGRVARC